MSAKSASSSQGNAPFWLLFGAMVAVGMANAVMMAILPMVGRELQLDEVEINLISSLSAFVVFWMSPVWGRYSEVWGRRAVMLIGLFGYPLAAVLFASTTMAGLNGWLVGIGRYVAFIAVRLIQASVIAASFPASMAYVSDITTPEQRTAGLARLSGANNLGTVLGPGLTFLASIHLLAPVYAGAVFTLTAGIVIWLRLRDSLSQASAAGSGAMVKLGYADPRYRRLLLIGVGLFSAMAFAQSTLSYFIQDQFGYGSDRVAQLFGLAMVVSSIFMLGGQLWLVPRLNWHPR